MICRVVEAEPPWQPEIGSGSYDYSAEEIGELKQRMELLSREILQYKLLQEQQQPNQETAVSFGERTLVPVESGVTVKTKSLWSVLTTGLRGSPTLF